MPRNDDDVFSKSVSRKRRDKAIDRVEAAADLAWLKTAYAALLHVAQMRKTFTADHVWMELRVRDACRPREPRALGAVFRAAARGHVCEALTMHDVCGRPKRHFGLVRVWQSLVYKATAAQKEKVLRSSTYGLPKAKASAKKASAKKASAKKASAKKASPKKASAKKASAKKASQKTSTKPKKPNWKRIADGRRVHFGHIEQPKSSAKKSKKSKRAAQ